MKNQGLRGVCLLAATLLLCVSSPAWAARGDALDPEPVRLEKVGLTVGGRADWITIDAGQVAFGSGRRIYLAQGPTPAVVRTELELSSAVLGATLVENRLYLRQANGIAVLDLDAPEAGAVPLRLEPEPTGELRMTRHVDHLVLAEDGVGLRFLALPPPAAMPEKHRRHFPGEPEQVAFFPLEESFTALATSGEAVYAATVGGRIAVVTEIGEKLELRYLAVEVEVRAMAANGQRLFLLGPSGMTILDVSGSKAPSTVGSFPDVRGNAITLAGRSALVAGDEGLKTYRDGSAEAATISVTLGNFFFNPQNITIDVGDTVEWNNSGAFQFHNTQACNGEVTNLCAGQTAVELWKGSGVPSGNPSSSPWTFSHTFTVNGFNPYICFQHQFSMSGSVTVQSSTVPPPGVPDGSGLTTPLTVGSVNPPTSTSLSVSWDALQCPDAAEHQIIYGFGSQLPATLGGTYSLSGSDCGILAAPPFNWIGVPDPAIDPSRFLWFLVVANDGATSEGSWGEDSAAGERDGTGTNGSSAECGITDKDLTNTCGQ